MLSDAYPAYLERTRHLLHCNGVPSGCVCPGVPNLWAISPRAVELKAPGKWMIFPNADADAVWSVVETHTKNGTLGFAAKVAFEKRDRPAIMIYTSDSNNADDKRHVEQSLKRVLRGAGFQNVAVGVKYKSDEATYSGRYSVLAPASKFKGGDAPSDICKFFANGACRNGDTCRFRHVAELGRAAGDGIGDIPMATCEICGDNLPRTDGIFCKAKRPERRHLLCKDCINQHATHELNGEKATEGLVHCPHVDGVGAGRVEERCTADPWTPEDLQGWLLHSTSAKLVQNLHEALKAKDEILENQRKELEAARSKMASEADELARRVAEAGRTAERKERLMKVRNTIIEDVMYVRCPRCKTVILDYEGCDALVCAKAGCGCGFCALCLRDCGRDAHEHLVQERYHGNRDYYGGMDNFNRTHRQRRIQLLKRAFAELQHEGPEFQQELLREMGEDLHGIGIDAADVLPGGVGAPAAGRELPRQDHRAHMAGDIRRGVPAALQGFGLWAVNAHNPAFQEARRPIAAGAGPALERPARPVNPDNDRPLAALAGADLVRQLQARYAELMNRDLNARERQWDADQLQDTILRIMG